MQTRYNCLIIIIMKYNGWVNGALCLWFAHSTQRTTDSNSNSLCIIYHPTQIVEQQKTQGEREWDVFNDSATMTTALAMWGSNWMLKENYQKKWVEQRCVWAWICAIRAVQMIKKQKIGDDECKQPAVCWAMRKVDTCHVFGFTPSHSSKLPSLRCLFTTQYSVNCYNSDSHLCIQYCVVSIRHHQITTIRSFFSPCSSSHHICHPINRWKIKTFSSTLVNGSTAEPKQNTNVAYCWTLWRMWKMNRNSIIGAHCSASYHIPKDSKLEIMFALN